MKKIETLCWRKYTGGYGQPLMLAEYETCWFLWGFKVWSTRREATASEVMERWS